MSCVSRNRDSQREIATWTRRYAFSRSIPALVGLAVMASVMLAIALFAKAMGAAYYQGGHPVRFWLCGAALVLLNGFIVWVSVPRWGGRWLERLGWRYYDSEGRVTPHGASPSAGTRRMGAMVAVAFGVAVFTHVTLGFAGYANIEHMQPVSALYLIPFTMFIAIATGSYLQLSFPLLYGLHAALLVAGVPLRFWSNPALDVPITVVGYMVISACLGHLYNRYALMRLKRASQALDVEESAEDV